MCTCFSQNVDSAHQAKTKLQANVYTLIKEINFLRDLFEVRMQERGRGGDAFRREPGTFGT